MPRNQCMLVHISLMHGHFELHDCICNNSRISKRNVEVRWWLTVLWPSFHQASGAERQGLLQCCGVPRREKPETVPDHAPRRQIYDWRGGSEGICRNVESQGRWWPSWGCCRSLATGRAFELLYVRNISTYACDSKCLNFECNKSSCIISYQLPLVAFKHKQQHNFSLTSDPFRKFHTILQRCPIDREQEAVIFPVELTIVILFSHNKISSQIISSDFSGFQCFQNTIFHSWWLHSVK